MTAVGTGGHSFTVRRATGDDFGEVVSILDGANLETDSDAVRGAIERESVLVVEPSSPDRSVILGALVLDGEEITQVAVRRGRRGQGIGTALVRGAAADRGSLRAEFDEAVRPFYEELSFEIDAADEPGRYEGRRVAENGGPQRARGSMSPGSVTFVGLDAASSSRERLPRRALLVAAWVGLGVIQVLWGILGGDLGYAAFGAASALTGLAYGYVEFYRPETS